MNMQYKRRYYAPAGLGVKRQPLKKPGLGKDYYTGHHAEEPIQQNCGYQ
jgi:hypothetical protein